MNATKGTAIDIDLGHSLGNLVVPKHQLIWHNWIHDSAASRTPKNRNEWLYWNTLSISYSIKHSFVSAREFLEYSKKKIICDLDIS